jgi:hypothetical protein
LVYYSVAEGSSDAVVVVSLAEDARLSAILSLARTVFISVVLGVGSVVFSKGVQDLVLTPIECMIARVDKIAENPLEAA